MLYQLKPLFMGEKESLPIDCEMDFSGLEYQNGRPFPHPVRVKGEIAVSADIVTLQVTASTRTEGRCDRCLTAFGRDMTVPIERILVSSLNNEENDDFVLLENYQLPLDDLVEEELILNLPSAGKTAAGFARSAGRISTRGFAAAAVTRPTPVWRFSDSLSTERDGAGNLPPKPLLRISHELLSPVLRRC